MSQPNYSVPPNEPAADAVRAVVLPANWKSSVAFRDYLLQTYEKGISTDQGLQHVDNLIGKIVPALLEQMILAKGHDDQIKAIAAKVDALERRSL